MVVDRGGVTVQVGVTVPDCFTRSSATSTSPKKRRIFLWRLSWYSTQTPSRSSGCSSFHTAAVTNYVYCLHPDLKQGPAFTNLFVSLSKCLNKVFIVSGQVDVYWGHRSIMDAQINCMRDLISRRSILQWRYVINLCGRELSHKRGQWFLLSTSRQAYITEEEYFSSLYRLRGTPGGSLSTISTTPVMVDSFIWIEGSLADYSAQYCSGNVVHDICIVSSGDLHRVLHLASQSPRMVFFHNKYFMEADHGIMHGLHGGVAGPEKHAVVCTGLPGFMIFKLIELVY